MMTNAVYLYEGNLYINLTNRCPCNCTFCIRTQMDGLGSADSLWLDRDPTAEEVIEDLGAYNLNDYDEIVFCGYGEPLCALDALLAVSRFIKSTGTRAKTRINTNGLGDLINGKPTAPLLKGLIDIVSVSLNAPDPKSYQAVVHSDYGEASFQAMLDFAVSCKPYVPVVKFTVVDVIDKQEIDDCFAISQRLNIPLRVRTFQS